MRSRFSGFAFVVDWTVHAPKLIGARNSANADDGLSGDPLGRVEGRDSIVEGRDGANVRPQSFVPHSLNHLAELGPVGLDDEVDGRAIRGPRLGRPDDGHECSSRPDQARGALPDVTAYDVEHHVDAADVLKRVALEVDELLRAEVESRPPVGRASGADDVRAGLSC